MVRQLIIFVWVAAVLMIFAPPPSRSSGGDASGEIAQNGGRTNACPSPKTARERRSQDGSKSDAKRALACDDRRPADATKAPEGSKIPPRKPKPKPESTFQPNEAY